MPPRELTQLKDDSGEWSALCECVSGNLLSNSVLTSDRAGLASVSLRRQAQYGAFICQIPWNEAPVEARV